MKIYRHSLLFSLLALLCLATAAAGPVVDVTVSNSAGKIVYKGKTDASGAFTTRNLAAGNYVVQFNASSPLKGGPFALVVNAGKESSDADALAAGKFSKGGVAMKIAVSQSTNLTGKIGPAGSLAKAAVATSSKGGAKTKMINGHEFVWIPPEQGDWNPGKWVASDSVEARNAQAKQKTKAGPGDPRE